MALATPGCGNVSYVNVPPVIVTVGVALFTRTIVVAVACSQRSASDGVNVTVSVGVPAPRIVPAAGEYVNVPGVFPAAFN